ncbi:MAG: Hemolysin-type calcium-binding region [Microvirga sp.]|nr:Hemolysin-type calcium-binding region [Microvirga sp.]
MLGGTGDDELIAGNGRDEIDGGAGIDRAVIDRSGATADIVFNLANPAARQTLDNGTTVVNVERIELKTGAGDDTVTGGRSDDILDGGAGDDTLRGLGGRDELFGGDGNDTLILATGARVADGGMGTDYAELRFEEARANLSFSVDANLIGTVTVGGIEVRDIERVRFDAGRGTTRSSGGRSTTSYAATTATISCVAAAATTRSTAAAAMTSPSTRADLRTTAPSA